MTAHDYLNFIVDEIHSTVVATVDGDGLPCGGSHKEMIVWRNLTI